MALSTLKWVVSTTTSSSMPAIVALYDVRGEWFDVWNVASLNCALFFSSSVHLCVCFYFRFLHIFFVPFGRVDETHTHFVMHVMNVMTWKWLSIAYRIKKYLHALSGQRSLTNTKLKMSQAVYWTVVYCSKYKKKCTQPNTECTET